MMQKRWAALIALSNSVNIYSMQKLSIKTNKAAYIYSFRFPICTVNANKHPLIGPCFSRTDLHFSSLEFPIDIKYVHL